MRILLFAAVVPCVLLAAAALAAASETKPTTSTGPTEHNGKTLKQWVEEINRTKTPDPGLRQRAIQAVTIFDPEQASKEASAALIESVADPDTSIRVNALMALTMIGVHKDQVRQALPALVRRLKEDTQGIVRLNAALALAEMELAARDAIPALIDQSKDLTSYEIRKACVIALARIGQADEKTPPDMRAITALGQKLTGGLGTYADTSAEVRLTAVWALGQMGVPADPRDKAVLVNALKSALRDPQKIIQIWARVSLIHIDGINDDYLKDIVVHLRGSDATCKVEAIKALGAVGPKAARVCLTDLMELLNEKDQGLMAGAAMALGSWGDTADKALPMLQKLHDAKDTDERAKPILKDAIEKIQGKKKP
jgi:HEAT repeat protein